ncbi:hypothetical protein ACFLZO_00580 [Patescibacteria group bacterium]
MSSDLDLRAVDARLRKRKPRPFVFYGNPFTLRDVPLEWLLYIAYPTFMFAGTFTYVSALTDDRHAFGVFGAAVMCITAVLLSKTFVKPLHCTATLLAATCATVIVLGIPFVTYAILATTTLVAAGACIAAHKANVPWDISLGAAVLQVSVMGAVAFVADIHVAAIAALCVIVPFLSLVGFRKYRTRT